MAEIDPNSVYLGYYANVETRLLETPLPYPGERHLLLFGPNGSGKGRGLIIPNLLSLENRSIIVIDPKGELAAVTADFRRQVGEVVILNPFGILDLPNAGFNPLASLDPDCSTFVDDVAGIGEALVEITGNDPHWSESARSLIVALIMWEVSEARRTHRKPTLENVRRLLTEADEYDSDDDGNERQVAGLKVTARKAIINGGFEIESLIGRFMRGTDEIRSIQSTADRQTSWMLSRPMRESLARDDLDLSELKKRPTTVYIVLPAERMRTHSVWLRLVIVSALRSLYKPGGIRTLFLLDEFAQLGHLEPIEDALGLVRGFGVQLWPVLQDLNQLKSLYEKRWESFMANAGVVLGFAPNDITTAEWMSKRAGFDTQVALGYNEGGSEGAKGQSANQGLSHQQINRSLILPQELMGLAEGVGMMFTAGNGQTIPFVAPPYWEIPVIKDRAKPNPHYEQSR